MLEDPHLVEEVLVHVRAADRAIQSAFNSDIAGQMDGEDLRNLFFDVLCRGLHGEVTENVVWSTYIEEFESRHVSNVVGPELHVLVDVEQRGARLLGGFLAVSVMTDADDRAVDLERGYLVNRCERMLRRSPMSFVFLFSQSGVDVIPCANVALSGGLRRLARWSSSEFFAALLKGFIGDRSLTSGRDKLRVRVIDKIGADVTIFMNAREHNLPKRMAKTLSNCDAAAHFTLPQGDGAD